jgi:hypothetical protein
MSPSAKREAVGSCRTPSPMLREPIVREGQPLGNTVAPYAKAQQQPGSYWEVARRGGKAVSQVALAGHEPL